MKQYKTIYADPPWLERGGGKIRRGADRHYSLMKTKDIVDLYQYIEPLINPDGCHLYLWVTNNFLPDGLEVMRSWGFQYKTCITWAKQRIGLGQYFRGRTEQLLFGVRRGLPYKTIDGKRQQGVTLITADRKKHSQKPNEAREMIEKVSYPPYLELFARDQIEGWDVWGDEIESSITLNKEISNK